MRRTRSSLVLSLLLTGALFAGACGSDDDDKESDTTTEETSAATADDAQESSAADAEDSEATEGAEGGTLVLGAEQEPDCVDWISSCAGSSWGFWTIGSQTMPRVFDMVDDGGTWVYEPSAVLTGEPKLEEVNGKQTVTYTISDDAVWDDGEPITSTDFKYTWEAMARALGWTPDSIERLARGEEPVEAVPERPPVYGSTPDGRGLSDRELELIDAAVKAAMERIRGEQ